MSNRKELWRTRLNDIHKCCIEKQNQFKDESFGDTMLRVRDLYFEPFDKSFNDKVKNLVKHSNFLDIIPVCDRIELIGEMLPWIDEYSARDRILECREKENEKVMDLFRPQGEANDKIPSDIKLIEKFKNLLIEHIFYSDPKLNPLDKEQEKPIVDLEEMLCNVESLKNDLEKKEFKIFKKARYYPKKTKMNKTGLHKILTCFRDNHGFEIDIKFITNFTLKI